jgi:hypothetical protein
MAISVLLACVLTAAAPRAPRVPAPDLAGLVRAPVPAATLPADRRFEQTETAREAELLARYLTRIWNVLATRGDASDLLWVLTVLQQFDCALWALDPNPSEDDVAARVRTYREWLVVVRHSLDRAGASGRLADPGPGRFGPGTEFVRFLRPLDQRYRSLCPRPVWDDFSHFVYDCGRAADQYLRANGRPEPSRQCAAYCSDYSRLLLPTVHTSLTPRSCAGSPCSVIMPRSN